MFATQSCNVTAILQLLRQNVIKHSVMLSVPSAVAAAILKFFDTRKSFLENAMPESQVFSSFTATVALLLVFRSVRALDIYKEGSRGVHQMVGAWYDSASTLFAFCRLSTAPREVVDNFKSTLVRLFSLLNMLCLVQLEDVENDVESHAWDFKAIDIEGLDAITLRHVLGSAGKAEVVRQTIQCLIVDSIHTGVLNLPPPILTRSFQDLGIGMLKFHDTLRLSHSPIPVTLTVVAELLLLLNVLVSPLMMALLTKGPFVAALCAFLNNFVFFILNRLAREIENPFGGDFNDIDVRTLHEDLNERLMELLSFSTAGAATNTSTREDTEIHFQPNNPHGWMPKNSRLTQTSSNKSPTGNRLLKSFSKRATRGDKRIQDLLSNAIDSSQERRTSKHSSVPFSALSSQQFNTKSSTPFSTRSSRKSGSSQQTIRKSMQSSLESPGSFMSSMPSNIEIEAITAREEACAVPNEASPTTLAGASGTPTSRQFGQALESLREGDESIEKVSEKVSVPPSVPSMHSSLENPGNLMSSTPYNIEIEAITAREEACAVPNEASPTTLAGASGAPTLRQFGQALESLREGDESIENVSENVRPKRHFFCM